MSYPLSASQLIGIDPKVALSALKPDYAGPILQAQQLANQRQAAIQHALAQQRQLEETHQQNLFANQIATAQNQRAQTLFEEGQQPFAPEHLDALYRVSANTGLPPDVLKALSSIPRAQAQGVIPEILAGGRQRAAAALAEKHNATLIERQDAYNKALIERQDAADAARDERQRQRDKALADRQEAAAAAAEQRQAAREDRILTQAAAAGADKERLADIKARLDYDRDLRQKGYEMWKYQFQVRVQRIKNGEAPGMLQSLKFFQDQAREVFGPYQSPQSGAAPVAPSAPTGQPAPGSPIVPNSRVTRPAPSADPNQFIRFK